MKKNFLNFLKHYRKYGFKLEIEIYSRGLNFKRSKK